MLNIYDESGWLVGAAVNKTTDLTSDDLDQLLVLATEEDQWAANVRNEVLYKDAHPGGAGIDWMINHFRTMNTGGTIIQFPFGYTCTVPSRRHLFRGENQEYPHTESSLSRRCRNKGGFRPKRDRELLHILANMRIAQFCKFIWQFDTIPQWEAKLSEVNYKALAQHYGFETFLLDLTNDIRDALFFATCKWVNDHFEPLTEADINRSEETRYGVLYHSPDWRIDYLNGANYIKIMSVIEKEGKRNRPSVIDTGLWDGIAYQIGLQPLYRAHSQFGYVYPMKTLGDIRESGVFERMRFRHNADFSKRIYDLMDGGEKIYPKEGITKVFDIFKKMQETLLFSEDDVEWAYDLDEADRTVFRSLEELRETLESDEVKRLVFDAYGLDGHLKIQKEEALYPISEELKAEINELYNDKSFLTPVGGLLHDTSDSKRYRRERFRQIYGAYPED